MNYGHCHLNSSELPRALAHTWKIQSFDRGPKPFTRRSALSAAYASQGIKRTAGSHPSEAYAADKAWAGHDRLDSANSCVTRRTAPLKFSLSNHNLNSYHELADMLTLADVLHGGRCIVKRIGSMNDR